MILFERTKSAMTRHTVLIVEDRPEIAARLQRAVNEDASLICTGIAATVDQGLTLLFDSKPRVVLVDLGLPDGSGIEIVRALAQADWTVDALVVSIFGDEERVVDAIKAGARGYVLKGGDLGTIAQDIVSLIEGGSPISPAIARHVLNMLSEGMDAKSDNSDTSLTQREIEVLRAVARGYKRREIGEMLGISAGTVGNHITSIYRKLEVRTNIEAVARAARIGVL